MYITLAAEAKRRLSFPSMRSEARSTSSGPWYWTDWAKVINGRRNNKITMWPEGILSNYEIPLFRCILKKSLIRFRYPSKLTGFSMAY